MNEALKRVATRTHSFVAADREISIDAGEPFYDLDSDIVFVHSVSLDGYLGVLQPSTEAWTPDGFTENRPTRYTLDRETQTIRFYPIPDGAYTAKLRVAHLPAKLSLDDMDAEVEVDEKYELTPADWVAYKCFSDPDSDGFAPGEAKLAKERFQEAVGEQKRDVYRMKTGPSARVHGQRVK
ncbi:MAG: hypothetical protein A2Y38_16540 [Spirochaetes bacterium GWB1_59_5]|nr:MAG: hypothetical protein A2Y38_16540 [Spirochaetes bacterium GWB1_59_5]